MRVARASRHRRKQHPIRLDPDRGVAARMIGAQRNEPDTDAAEIELVLALERQVRFAKLASLSNSALIADRDLNRSAVCRPNSSMSCTGPCATSWSLPERPAHRGHARDARASSPGRACAIHRAARCDLGDGRAVARTEPGVDHQHARFADHEADIGDERTLLSGITCTCALIRRRPSTLTIGSEASAQSSGSPQSAPGLRRTPSERKSSQPLWVHG